jgi:hypothetical protein
MSSINVDLFCEIYVSTSLDREALTELLYDFGKNAVRHDFFKVDTNEISMRVCKNDSYDPQKDSFVNFKFYLEVNAFIGVDQPYFLLALAKLMVFLKKQGWDAVAACDWETELAALVEDEMKRPATE